MNEIDDDWFFESIKSYKTLQMYDLQMKPSHMIQLSDDSLCLAGLHRTSGRTEVLCIELPAKLTLSEEEGDRCKGNDFDICSGGFINEEISNLGMIAPGEKAVVSLKRTLGLTILEGLNTTSVVKGEVLSLDVETPNFSVHPIKNQLFVTKNTSHGLKYVDLESGIESSHNLPLEIADREDDGEIISRYSGTTCVVLLNRMTGKFLTLDERSNHVSELFGNNEEKDDMRQGFGVTLACNGKQLIGTLSHNGEVSVYDRRNPATFLARGEIETVKSLNDLPFQMHFGSSNKISLSGFGSDVYVCDVSGREIVNTFTHYGHSKQSNDVGLVTDHLWLSHIADNLLISCAENGSLNCWEFVMS